MWFVVISIWVYVLWLLVCVVCSFVIGFRLRFFALWFTWMFACGFFDYLLVCYVTRLAITVFGLAGFLAEGDLFARVFGCLAVCCCVT